MTLALIAKIIGAGFILGHSMFAKRRADAGEFGDAIVHAITAIGWMLVSGFAA
jgi:hypothetical protein